jgi:hypothetical protein
MGATRREFYGHGLSEAVVLLCVDPNLLARPEHSEHEI